MLVPPIDGEELQCLGTVSQATKPPEANSTIDDTMNGIA